MKIFIDTNIFLDFYRSNADTLEILKELNKYQHYIVFPIHVFSEYLRNRTNTLNQLIRDINKANFPTIYSSTLSRYSQKFNEYGNLNKQFKKNKACLLNELKDMQENSENDPIFKIVKGMLESETVIKYEINDEIIDRAKRRNTLRNPPKSDDKAGNICDEIIWESLLANLKEDLIIVSRDITYENNYEFLKYEYQKLTKKNIIKIVNKINEAIKLTGNEVPKDIENLEKQQIIDIEKSMDNDIEYCQRCHTYSEFSGIKCTNCGALGYGVNCPDG